MNERGRCVPLRERVGDGVRSWQLLFRTDLFPCYKIRVRVGINNEILILIPTVREIQTVDDDAQKGGRFEGTWDGDIVPFLRYFLFRSSFISDPNNIEASRRTMIFSSAAHSRR